jgi:hypothetical protein
MCRHALGAICVDTPSEPLPSLLLPDRVPLPDNALYWSHAGAHFALDVLGLWWAGTARHKWPDGGDEASGEVHKVLRDFDRGQSAWGDRRQEIVLIGIGMDEGAIRHAFDAALLSDAEMLEFHTYMEVRRRPAPRDPRPAP